MATHETHGVLYVVATPIGNLDDLSGRACTVLREADTVLAEDTRRTRVLFDRYAIPTPTRAFHEHNEREETPRILAWLLEGRRFALVSDAGTPLVSDPGYVLVREARSHDVPVHCVPGPSAVTAALSVSGLPTDRFTFEGFPAGTPVATNTCARYARARDEDDGVLRGAASHPGRTG